ncbi:MAG: complex I NDUFA9 subunit family protein [Pseudomonadota bacterium]
MQISRVCLVGATGFVGGHLLTSLSRAGFACRVLARKPHRHRELGVLPGVEVVANTDFSAAALAKAFSGCDAVVNLVGILNEGGGHTFHEVHVELVGQLMSACRKAHVRRLLHMSALNASETAGTSLYLRTKGAGENRAHSLGAPSVLVTSFRPSVIFGRDDSFINRFRALMNIPGPLPLACPGALFAPVFVGDVAEAFTTALTRPSCAGRAFDLCGPRVFTLEEIVAYIARHAGVRKRIMGLSDRLSRLQARMLGLVPGKPFTLDNYNSLQLDSVCKQNHLPELGITPTDMDAVVPEFLRPA